MTPRIDQTDVYAFYKLRFYELDQPVAVGDDAEFEFFGDPHFAAAPDAPACPGMVLVFANTAEREGVVAHHCLIRSIEHPVLGAIQSIRTDGLVYRITLKSGEVVVVDAEERAGTVEGGGHADIDWAFLVELEPRPAARGTAGHREKEMESPTRSSRAPRLESASDPAVALFRLAAVIQILVLLVVLFGDIGFDKPGRFGLDYGHGLLLAGLWLIASVTGLVAAGWRRNIGLVFVQLAMAAVSIALSSVV